MAHRSLNAKRRSARPPVRKNKLGARIRPASQEATRHDAELVSQPVSPHRRR